MMVYVHLIFLSVFLPVSVISESYDTMEGEALVVRCPHSVLSAKVTWHHTGTRKRIPEEEEGSRVFSKGIFLWFLPTSLEDSGNYTCVINYPDGSKKERKMNVQVHPYKQGTCFPSRILYANETRKGKISCPTFRNYENATIIQWYKDCRPIQGERYFMHDPYIFIENLNKEDDGYYTCQFTYTHRGRVFNVSATRIFVSEAKHSSLPVQILFPKDEDVLEVELGAAFSLKCQARLGIKKQPIAVVTWDVNKMPAEYADEEKIRQEFSYFEGQHQEYYGEATLTISNIEHTDLQSSFSCVAMNEMGNTRTTVTLRLKKKYGKIYDAYVIYPRSHSTEATFVEYFVYQIMPDILENKCGYTLCIYGRDTYPGEDKANAIEKRIQKSRRLIILLTQQLINCQELNYDQHIALYNALIQNDTKVILLEMEKMGSYENLQESLRYIIKQQGTVKWKEQHTVHPQSSNSKFWKHVRYHMPVTLRSSDSANAG
ncbi:interleukin-1 receptor-like 1 isoform LV precursor [Gallus gallus]|uniref:ST2LV n=1 Tax=Gallus gallus TaxID=9031 RepID=Q9DEE4_CHICK|nr:interleukin-1 receptor-like 1 isoform LV precursor [Gallus gallus]BAB20774.1 ST2LV [Gallus gallus]|eukprot:NP_001019762.1 interleukin-1 receptor-like 1 isoform LV precursor [Gallus gallus]